MSVTRAFCGVEFDECKGLCRATCFHTCLTFSASVRPVLQQIEQDYIPPEPTCSATEYSEINRVPLKSLVGLWVILAAAVGVALAVAIGHYLVLRRLKPQSKAAIDARLQPFKDSLRATLSVRSAAAAFQHAGAQRRARDAAVATPPGADEPSSSDGRGSSAAATDARRRWASVKSKSLRESDKARAAVESLGIVSEGRDAEEGAKAASPGTEPGGAGEAPPRGRHWAALAGKVCQPDADPPAAHGAAAPSGKERADMAQRSACSAAAGAGLAGESVAQRSGASEPGPQAHDLGASRRAMPSAAQTDAQVRAHAAAAQGAQANSGAPIQALAQHAAALAAQPVAPLTQHDLTAELAALIGVVKSVDARVAALMAAAQDGREQ